MMKVRIKLSVILFCLMAITLLVSCDFESSVLSNVGQQDIKVRRLDRIEYQYLATGEFTALQQMSTEFPTETRTLIEDILNIGKMDDEATSKKFLMFYQDSTLQSVLRDTEEKFANMDQLDKDLTEAFKKLNEMFPKIAVPTVYTQITAFDQSIVIKDGSIGISLDKYLGENYPHYKEFFDSKQRKKMTPRMIVPDCLVFYMVNAFPMKDFAKASQEKRDEHIGKLQWLTNRIVGFRAYDEPSVKKVEKYVRENPDITPEEMMDEEE